MNKITVTNQDGKEVINPQIKYWESLSLHETTEIVCAPLDKIYEGHVMMVEWLWS